ncbi:zf-HC2 domain-containing protein [candidate division KSB1 bacterium]|nr:zf-HC2 domain-containing protein [candidate division KSB1 bacterium]
MNCKRVKDNLIDLLEGELVQSESRAVEDHLKGCPRCREDYQSLKTQLKLFGKVEVPDPGAIFWQNYLPRLRRRLEEKQRGKTWGFQTLPLAAKLVPVGLVILFIAALVTFMGRFTGGSGPPGEIPFSWETEVYDLTDLLVQSGKEKEVFEALLAEDERPIVETLVSLENGFSSGDEEIIILLGNLEEDRFNEVFKQIEQEEII